MILSEARANVAPIMQRGGPMASLATHQADYEAATKGVVREARAVREEIATKSALARLERLIDRETRQKPANPLT